jgi:hypothetical protein
MEGMMTVKDPAALARTTITWLQLWVVFQVAFAVAACIENDALSVLPGNTVSTFTESPDLPLWVVISTGIIYLFNVVVLIVTSILVLRWIYRSNAIAQTFGERMTVSPGWNVGFFFVPILNLWKPFQGLREIWQVSFGEYQWSDTPVPSILRWWWGLWLVMSILDNASFRLSIRAATVKEVMTVNEINIFGSIIALPLGWCLISIIRRLTAQQCERLR